MNSDPYIQNIPPLVRTELAKKIREAFRKPLSDLKIDYASIEKPIIKKTVGPDRDGG